MVFSPSIFLVDIGTGSGERSRQLDLGGTGEPRTCYWNETDRVQVPIVRTLPADVSNMVRRMREKRRTASPTWKYFGTAKDTSLQWGPPTIPPSANRDRRGDLVRIGTDGKVRSVCECLLADVLCIHCQQEKNKKGKVINRLIGIRKFDAETTRGTNAASPGCDFTDDLGERPA
ncbi:hypothetical protein M0657_002979 [Pyricularia oryzae]|nr:hypothetical protein M9X92_002300 [Pyricularia oryzae]KAI7927860.1 hypothetical protein M0657_002979 [Pyricularia oryzae]